MDQFPSEVGLNDGTRILLRPLHEKDGPALWDFYRSLPAELRRLSWEDVDHQEEVESWAREVDHEKTLPLVALDGTRIVADATLHFRRKGPLRLVGRIRWFIHPDYRGRGLGANIGRALIEAGRRHGLRFISCMLATRLEALDVRALESCGFVAHHFPDYGTDPDGNAEDMTYLSCRL